MIKGAIAVLSLAATSAAGDISLVFPVQCTLGDTCHIQQTVDHDPGPAASDFRCGSLTYDGHQGTDIALPTLAAMTAGVTVLAAADGTVAGVRDGVTDGLQGSPDAPDVAGLECGNGVLIRHPDGWETQYCHLARGSVSVAPDDEVEAGTPLGRIGLSGQTQFPHLHLSVRRDGVAIDPFDPDGAIACGVPSTETLWVGDITAPPGGVLTAGLSNAVPEYDAIKTGTVGGNPARDTALVLWAYFYGNRAGDSLSLTITGPDGPVFADSLALDRTQAQAFRAAGRRAPQRGWPAGTYRGEIVLTRDGMELDRQETSTRIE